MSWVIAALVWILFAVLVRVTGLLAACLRVLATLRAASWSFLDVRLSDLQKERAARSAAKDLLVLFMNIIVRIAVAVLVPIAGAWVLDSLDVAPLDQVATLVQSRPLLLFGALATSGALYFER